MSKKAIAILSGIIGAIVALTLVIDQGLMSEIFAQDETAAAEDFPPISGDDNTDDKIEDKGEKKPEDKAPTEDRKKVEDKKTDVVKEDPKKDPPPDKIEETELDVDVITQDSYSKEELDAMMIELREELGNQGGLTKADVEKMLKVKEAELRKQLSTTGKVLETFTWEVSDSTAKPFVNQKHFPSKRQFNKAAASILKEGHWDIDVPTFALWGLNSHLPDDPEKVASWWLEQSDKAAQGNKKAQRDMVRALTNVLYHTTSGSKALYWSQEYVLSLRFDELISLIDWVPSPEGDELRMVRNYRKELYGAKKGGGNVKKQKKTKKGGFSASGQGVKPNEGMPNVQQNGKKDKVAMYSFERGSGVVKVSLD